MKKYLVQCEYGNTVYASDDLKEAIKEAKNRYFQSLKSGFIEFFRVYNTHLDTVSFVAGFDSKPFERVIQYI